MPQLDISSYPSQLFWLAVTFAVLFYILLRVALPKISGVLQDRQQTISNNLDNAATYKEEAENLEAEYMASLKEVREQAREKIAKAHAEIQQLTENEHKKLDEFLAKQAVEASSNIEKSSKDALESISEVSAELSQLVVEKLSGLKLSKNDALKAINKNN